MRKFLWVPGSIRTWATLELICDNHKITMSQLVGRILEVTTDETLLQAVRPISKVLTGDSSRLHDELVERLKGES